MKTLETLIPAMFATLARHGLQSMTVRLQDEVERYLKLNWAPQARMLWVVTSRDVDIVRIGVHRKLNEYARALVISAEQQGAEQPRYFLISPVGITSISAYQAYAEIQRMDFIVSNQTVSRPDGVVVATFTIEPRWMEQRMAGTVKFSTATAVSTNPSLNERLALRHIAASEMVVAWHSLFAAPSEVLLDGEPLTCEREATTFELMAS